MNICEVPTIEKFSKASPEASTSPILDYQLLKVSRSKSLHNKVALVTNADTRLGREIAVGIALQGANVVMVYDHNDREAEITRLAVEQTGRYSILLRGSVVEEKSCNQLVRKALFKFGQLDILVNHIHQFRQSSVSAGLPLIKSALTFMKSRSCIINSVTQPANPSEKHDTAKDVLQFITKVRNSILHPSIRITGIAPYIYRSHLVGEIAPMYTFIASEMGTMLNNHLVYIYKQQVVKSSFVKLNNTYIAEERRVV